MFDYPPPDPNRQPPWLKPAAPASAAVADTLGTSEPAQALPGWVPWQQRPDETPAAWAGFQLYLNLGAPSPTSGVPTGIRSISATHRALGHNQPNTVKRWAKAYDWRGRADAYDQSIARRATEAAGGAAEVLAVRQVNAAGRLLEVVETELARLTAETDEGVPVCRSPAEVATLLKVAQDVSRLALGQSSTNVSIRSSSASAPPEQRWQLERLTLEELIVFEALRAKATGTPPKALGAEAELRAAVAALPAGRGPKARPEFTGAQIVATPPASAIHATGYPAPSNPFG